MNKPKPFLVSCSALVAIGAAIAFVGCKKDDATSKLPEAQRSVHFESVAKRLDIGGMMFAYVDIDHDAERLAVDINRLKDMMAEASPNQAPPEIVERLDFVGLVSDLGLDRLVAIGASSVRDGDRFINKAILYTPEGRSGVFRLLGGSAGPFTTLQMAPADADLVMERDLNLKAAMDVGQKIAARFPQGEESFSRAMGQSMMNMGMSIGDFFGKLDTKVIVIARVDAEKQLEMPMAPMELPEIELLIGLHNVPWLWAQIKEQMPPEGEGPVEFSEGEGYEAFLMADMFGNAKLRPQLYFDKKSNLILLGTSPDFIATCLDPGATIETRPDFQNAMAGLPTEGNGLSYASPEIVDMLMNLFESSAGMAASADPNALLGLELIKMFIPDQPEGVASVSVNMEDGVYVTSNAFESHKSTMMLTANPTVIAMFAAMGMPAYQKVKMKADSTKQINNVRQVILVCRTYAADENGLFPDTLSDVVPDYIDETSAESLLYDRSAGLPQPLEYNGGLTDTSPGDLVLVATPESGDGMRVVGYVDGSVEQVPEFHYIERQEATEEHLRENANR